MSQPDPQDPTGDSPSRDSWLREFVQLELREEASAEFLRRVTEGILEQVPAVAEDPILKQELVESTRSQWRSFLGLLAEPEYHHELPPQAGHLARSVARRGLDLGILLKVYRTAQQLVFGYVTEATQGPLVGSPGRHDALAFVWSRAGSWLDDTIEQLIEVYYQERRRVDQGAQALRAARIEHLLSDHPGAVDSGASTRELGHPLHHWQTGFVLWADHAATETGDSFSDLSADAAAALAKKLHAPPPLLHLVGSRDLWGWCATAAEPDLGVLLDLENLLDAQDLRVAVGTPGRGVAGFRSTHAEAKACQRLSATAALAPRVVDFRDVELLCLCAGNEELTDRMVVREIESLCGADKNLALLRQTALAFLTHRSIEAAAQELFVHKNTVRYRLSRAEELLGHPLTERAAHLEIALRHVALFGPPEVKQS